MNRVRIREHDAVFNIERFRQWIEKRRQWGREGNDVRGYKDDIGKVDVRLLEFEDGVWR